MKNLTILCVLLVILSSCNGQKKKYPYPDVTLNHIEFSKITFTVNEKRYDAGSGFIPVAG